MSLMTGQVGITPQRGMPVELRNGSAGIEAISGEVVLLYYSNSGVRTVDAGQLAGVAVSGVLQNRPVMNSDGTAQATNRDTSLSFTSTAFTSEVPFPADYAEGNDATSWATRVSAITNGFANGEYCVDYAHGIIYGVKASTQVSLTSTAYNILGGNGLRTVSNPAVILNAKAATGVGTAIDVRPYKDIMVAVSAALNSSLTYNFQGSIGISTTSGGVPAFGSAQSITNHWDYIAAYDMDSPGTVIVGSTGVTINNDTVANNTKLYLINVDALSWLNMDVTAYTDGNVTAFVVGYTG